MILLDMPVMLLGAVALLYENDYKKKKVRRAEITFGKVISAEKTGRLFYFSPFSGYVYKEK